MASGRHQVQHGLTIGVALATYNGAAYLEEQLASLAGQTRQPDQVVIADDGSSDATREIALRFQREARCRVEILESTGRLGPMGNFMRASLACRTEFVAFCDQDDTWAPGKLEACYRRLRGANAAALIHSTEHFSAQDVVDEPPSLVPDRQIDGLGLAPNRVFFGMSMVVRRTLLEEGEPLKAAWEPRFDQIAGTRPVCLQDHWCHAHDMYALTLARVSGPILLHQETLAKRRVHAQNYSSGGSSWRQAREIADSWGSGREVGYRLLAAFCRDFAETIRAHEAALPVTASRRRLILDHYRRWAAIREARGRLHARGTSFPARTRQFLAIGGSRGYANVYRGGLGPRSLAKDVLAVVGAR